MDTQVVPGLPPPQTATSVNTRDSLLCVSRNGISPWWQDVQVLIWLSSRGGCLFSSRTQGFHPHVSAGTWCCSLHTCCHRHDLVYISWSLMTLNGSWRSYKVLAFLCCGCLFPFTYFPIAVLILSCWLAEAHGLLDMSSFMYVRLCKYLF